MGSDMTQQPHAAPPVGQPAVGAGAGDDDRQSADIVIKAGGIYSMAADPFACAADVLAELLPVLTVVGGRPRHDPNGHATPGGAPGADTSS